MGTAVALIFDFDGVVKDTEGPWFIAWRNLFARLAPDKPALTTGEWSAVVGNDDDRAAISVLAERRGCSLRARHWETTTATALAAMAHAGPMPGVPDAIAGARRLGYAIGLASNARRSWVDAQLPSTLSGAFDAIVARDDVARGKPHPDLLLACASALDVPPVRTVVVEDSPIGARAAVAAGMRCTIVPTSLTMGMVFPEGCTVVPTLEALDLLAERDQLMRVARPAG